jgi:hypothetical protein
MNCPVCGSRTVGKVGLNRYYCWECFVEYQYQSSKVKIFSVAEDGSLVDFESVL